MANTQSHVIGFIERIHTSRLLTPDLENIRVSLSTQENSLAQLELRDLNIHRGLGRRVLQMQVFDLSGMPERLGRPDVSKLRLPLGQTAIVGRGRLGLPVLELDSVSEEHLELSFMHGEAGYLLGIHDHSSVNGSHVVNPDRESTWDEQYRQFMEIAAQDTGEVEVYRDTTVYKNLFAPNGERYFQNPRIKS